jgi:hypothetical protein
LRVPDHGEQLIDGRAEAVKAGRAGHERIDGWRLAAAITAGQQS